MIEFQVFEGRGVSPEPKFLSSVEKPKITMSEDEWCTITDEQVNHQ